MNVTETQQNYTNYQTQNNDSTSKTESKEKFSNILEGVTSYETSVKININEEKYDEKYKNGFERYSFFSTEGWFNNSIVEKDEKLNQNFITYLGDMTQRDYSLTITTFARDFLPQLTQDVNGQVINGQPLKNSANELSTINSIVDYFQNNIEVVKENAKKWGGDPTEEINLFNNISSFFKEYQSKEQENQYKTLGNLN
jgi:hypothetical protein